MVEFTNRAGFVAASAGTVDFVVNTTLTGFAEPNDALPAMVDGAEYNYIAESTDRTQWAYGTGVWNQATQTLTRNDQNSVSGTTPYNFSAPPNVIIGNMLAQDMPSGIPAVLGYDAGGTSGLDYAYFGGYVSANGVPVSVGASTVTLADDTTNQVYFDTNANLVVAVDTGWPDPAPYIIPMAEVVTVTGAVDTVLDVRGFLFAPGSGGGGGVTNPLSANLDVGGFQIVGADATGSDPGGSVEIVGGNAVDGDGGSAEFVGGESQTGQGGGVSIGAGQSTDGPGGNFNATAGDSATGNGGGIEISAGAGVAGGSAELRGGIGSSAGGNATLYGGDSPTGEGGSVLFQGGEGDTGGGGASIAGGGSDNGDGGDINLTGGYSNNGNGGNVDISAGSGSAVGGLVSIRGGEGTANGGQVEINGGLGPVGAGGSVSIAGASINLTTVDAGFISAQAGNNAAGNGGSVEFRSGSSDDANGGVLFFSAGEGAVDGGRLEFFSGEGDSGNGGNITFETGQTTTGNGGDITFTFGTGGTRDGLFFPNLPTADPGVSGAAWNDGGVLAISGEAGSLWVEIGDVTVSSPVADVTIPFTTGLYSVLKIVVSDFLGDVTSPTAYGGPYATVSGYGLTTGSGEFAQDEYSNMNAEVTLGANRVSAWEYTAGNVASPPGYNTATPGSISGTENVIFSAVETDTFGPVNIISGRFQVYGLKV